MKLFDEYIAAKSNGLLNHITFSDFDENNKIICLCVFCYYANAVCLIIFLVEVNLNEQIYLGIKLINASDLRLPQ